jgi:C1A family cysteine protease
MDKKRILIGIVLVLALAVIIVLILNHNSKETATRHFKPNPNFDVNKLAEMRSKLKDSKIMAEAFEKLSETEKGQVILEKIKEYQAQVQTQETEINSYLKQNNIPSSLNSELDTIDNNAQTWDANYNEMYIQNDETKERMNGFNTKISVVGESMEYVGNTIKQLNADRLSNFQNNPDLSNYPKLIPIIAQIRASHGASSINTSGESYQVIIDWRNYNGMNFMTPVKNQGECGSCWAFASSAVFEAQTKINANNPNLDIDLSEQDLVSCYLPNTYSVNGCDGATQNQIKNLFSSYIQTSGETTESCFSYQASGSVSCSNKCSNWQSQTTKISSQTLLPLNNIAAIKDYLQTKGPILTAMNVYRDLYSYTTGIYKHTTNQLEGGHAIVIVGYGEYNGKTFWIVKNSWGESWGEEGYFKIFAGDSDIESIILQGAK